MIEVITVGETMVSMVPDKNGFLRYVNYFEKKIAGAESNVAIGCAKLGHKSGWLSKVGCDEFGATILRELNAEGIDTSRVKLCSDYPTGLMFKQVLAGDETSVIYYRTHSAASTFSEEDIPLDYLRQAKLVHCTGITPILSDSCEKAIDSLVRQAKDNGLLFSFDPNIRMKLWRGEQSKQCLLSLLKKCDIALLGLEEAHVLLGLSSIEQIIDVLRSFGVSHIAVKLGADGAVVADKAEAVRIKPVKTTVLDNIGAGDAFNAGFLCGLLEDKPLKDCGKMGALMGALAVSTNGDYEIIPDRGYFDRLLDNQNIIYR